MTPDQLAFKPPGQSQSVADVLAQIEAQATLPAALMDELKIRGLAELLFFYERHFEVARIEALAQSVLGRPNRAP